jgi:hypothetical protein
MRVHIINPQTYCPDYIYIILFRRACITEN